MNEMSRAELSAVFPGTTILTRNGKHSTVPLYRSRRNALIERLGGRCVNCGATERLQFHHVNERKEGQMPGGWQMLLRIERELEKGVKIELMCRSCHQFHHLPESYREEEL